MTLTDTSNKVASEGSTSVSEQEPQLDKGIYYPLYYLSYTEIQTLGIRYQRKQQALTFADNVEVTTKSKKQLKNIFSKMEKSARISVLKINEARDNGGRNKKGGTSDLTHT